MHWLGGWFWGMHLLWWLLGIGFVVMIFTILILTSRNKEDATPLQILQRRYASGEISTAEYEERKTHIIHDAQPHKS